MSSYISVFKEVSKTRKHVKILAQFVTKINDTFVLTFVFTFVIRKQDQIEQTALFALLAILYSKSFSLLTLEYIYILFECKNFYAF